MRRYLVSLIIIGFIAVTLFAFVGVFGRFPDNWEWIGIVLGGAGIAMATPTIFQMFYGRACIEHEFEVDAQGDKRFLIIFLKNPPIRSRALKTLGVKRETIQSLTAEIRISEVDSKRIIIPIRHCRLFSDEDVSEEGSNRIMLPPTYSVGACIMVAMWDDENRKAVILGDRLRQPLLLGAGCYYAHVIIIVDGEPRQIERQFVVGNKADDLIWASAS